VQALADFDLNYQVSGIVENFDVEVPMVIGFDENDAPQFGDMRLTDYDVVAKLNITFGGKIYAHRF
jgi:hypothetical protein